MEGAEQRSWACWYCGERVSEEQELNIAGLGIGLKPQSMWEIADIPPMTGVVYVHKREWEAAMKEMDKAFMHLVSWRDHH